MTSTAKLYFYQDRRVQGEKQDSPEQQDVLALLVLQDRPDFLDLLVDVVQLVSQEMCQNVDHWDRPVPQAFVGRAEQ